MSTEPLRAHLEVSYFAAAQDYLRALPPEHFMEATPQATQRAITLASFALITAVRPDVHVFNELLVQYRIPRQKQPGQVVPDNMVVLHDGPIDAEVSYDVPLQPAEPFLMLEYVSKRSKRKDYEDNREHYERRLKVPFYLLFYPQIQELTLFRHNGRRFVTVRPNENDRYAVPQLELEAAILDGWVRFWFRGKLLPLPAELQQQRDAARSERDDARSERDTARRQLDEAQRAQRNAEEEVRQLRAELERRRNGRG